MTDRLAAWVALVDSLYPEADAEPWDAAGLQIGDPDDPVNGVLVALDVTAATIGEAVSAGADLLLAHHPLLFRPLESLTPDTAAGALALRAVRAGVAVVAAHTNFDVAAGGTTDPVMRILGIAETRPLAPTAGPGGDVKLVAFVPPDATDGVLDAVAEAGAGVIGEYDHCSFRVRGTGTFRPSAIANPTVGRRGQRNAAEEDRLEVVVPRPRIAAVVTALRQAHPYEEVAYDLVRLDAAPTGRGLGRVGVLDHPLPLGEVAARLARELPAAHLRVAGDLDRPVQRVAACGGAGDSLIAAAQRAGADVFVSGDLRHHVTLDALTMGMAMIDAGHYATEAAALPDLIEALRAAAGERGLTARLLPSAVSTEPWSAFTAEQEGARA